RGRAGSAREVVAYARRPGCDPDVHRQGQLDSEPDRGPVDRGDHRLLHVEDSERDDAAAVAVVLGGSRPAARGGVERRAAGAEIGARAEGAPGPGHDDRTYGVVGVGAIPRLAELAKHRRGDRVEPIPAVQGYRADSVLDVVADLAEGHHCPSWNSIRPSVVPSEA